MSIASRLWVSATTTLAVLALMTGLVYWTVDSSAKLADARRDAARALMSAELVLSDLRDAETEQRGYLLTGDDAYLAPFEDAAKSLPERLAALAATTAASPALAAEAARLSDIVGAKLGGLQETIAVRRDKGFEAAERVVQAGSGKQEMDTARALVAKIENVEHASVLEDEAALQALEKRLKVGLLISCLVVALCLVVTKWLVIRSLAKPLSALDKGIRRIASGDLADDIPVTGHDEHTQLARTFNTVIAELRAERASRLLLGEERSKLLERIELANAAAHVGVWDMDVATGRIVWDDMMFEIYGIEHRSDMSVALWSRFLHPEDVGRVTAGFDISLASLVPFDAEFRVVRGDGELRHFRAMATVVPADPGTSARVVGVNWDMTETRQLADALGAEKERLQDAKALLLDAVESISDGLVLYDADWRFAMCNTRYKDLFPRSADLFVPGVTRRDLLIGIARRGDLGPVEDAERHVDDFLALDIAAGEIYERPLGDGRWILLSDRPTAAGGWVGLRTDITEQKRREFALNDTRERLEAQASELVAAADALAVAKDEAERANRVKSEFLAMMSHEIRTPMNGIMGMTGLLLSTELTSEQQRFAETVRLSADSLLTIISDILDVSKLEAGKFDLELVDFNVASVIEDAVALLAPKAQEKGLEIAADLDLAAVGALRGDPTRLRQVVLNLLSNAVKFTERGFVFVRATGGKGAEGVTTLRLEVHDSGIGIAETTKAKLFQPFQQADSSISRRFGGTGLGLNISRQLIELMGGRIGVGDRPGGGSVFWIELSLPPGDALPAQPLCRPEILRGKRVLVVDDTDINRFVLSRQLAANGMEVVVANGAVAALAALDEAARGGRSFDVAILDQVMPGMSGIALADEMGRRYERRPKLVLLSSVGQPEGGVAKSGVDAILSKPAREQALIECLARAVGAAAPPNPATAACPAAAPAATGGRILLAEDNAINRDVATTILRRAGYEVDTAADGLEAIAALQHGRYQLVLMDMQMPNLDGVEATRRIRASAGDFAGLPVIAMTANAMESDRRLCLQAGMDDYVSKPIDPRGLLATVKRWILAGEATCDGFEEPPAADKPAFDEAHLAELREIFPPEAFADLLRTYLDGAAARVERLTRFAANDDMAGLRKEAHELISTAGNLGIRQLASLGSELHEACRAEDSPRAKALAAEIRDASPVASFRLRDWLPRDTAGSAMVPYAAEM